MAAQLQFIFVLTLTLVSQSSFAVEQNQTKQSTYKQTSVTNESSIRAQWGLEKTEWDRYQELMKGIRGSLSVENISPLEVLGIHAKTDQERKKYAMAWAKVMKEDTERVLKFQFAFDDAARQINDRHKVIDMAKLNKIRNKQSGSTRKIQPGDRVVLFINYNNCSSCEIKARMLQNEIQRTINVQFDIFFIDTEKGVDDKKIRDWSTRVGINREMLIKGKTTINHDKKLINTYFGFASKVPVAAVIRNKQFSKI